MATRNRARRARRGSGPAAAVRLELKAEMRALLEYEGDLDPALLADVNRRFAECERRSLAAMTEAERTSYEIAGDRLTTAHRALHRPCGPCFRADRSAMCAEVELRPLAYRAAMSNDDYMNMSDSDRLRAIFEQVRSIRTILMFWTLLSLFVFAVNYLQDV